MRLGIDRGELPVNTAMSAAMVGLVSIFYGVPLALHPLDLPLLRQNGGAALFGLEAPPSPDPDLELAEGDTISFGSYTLQVLYTPGHTPGHVSFYEPRAKIVFDLPGGDFETLMHSITEKLMVLPDDTTVCSGHGPITSIGRERTGNPWL